MQKEGAEGDLQTPEPQTEMALREGWERLRTFFTLSFAGLSICENNRYVEANNQLGRMLGYQPSEMIGRELTDFIAPEERERVLDNIRAGQEVFLEHTMIRKDGTRIQVEVHGRTVEISGRRLRFSTLRDITEQKRAQEKMAWLASFPERNPMAVVEIGLDGHVFYVNPVARQLFPDLEERGLKHPWMAGAESLAAQFQDEKTDSTEREVTVQCRAYSQIIHYIREVRRLRFHGRDITDRKRAEEALRASEEFNRSLIESSVDCIKTLDLEGRLVSMSTNGQKLLEIDDICPYLGKCWVDLWQEDVRPCVWKAIAAARAGGSGRFQAFSPTPRGHGKWWDIIVTPVRGQDGRIEQLLSVARDITEQKENEKALRESEERLKLFTEHAPAAIAMFDRDMRYIAASRRWLADYAPNEKNILGRSHYDVFPELPERWKEAHRRGLAGAIERADEDFFVRKDGRQQWVRWEVRPWYEAQGAVGGIVVFAEDITEKKLAEQAVHQSEERFRTVANAIPQLAWIAKPNGAAVWFNQRWYEYTGTRPKDVEEWGWQKVIDPRELPRVFDAWKNAFSTGQMVDMEVLLRAADGQFRPFLTRVIALKDENGKVVCWFGTNTDITEIVAARETLARSRTELERLVAERTAQLVVANANLQGFAYSVAHDLRAPLRSIKGFSEMVVEDCGTKLEVEDQNLLARVVDSAGQMERLLNDLLEYSKISQAELKLEPVDLNKAVRQALELLEGDIKTKDAIVRVVDGLPVVTGHVATVVLLVNNFVSNALKFMAPGKRPEIQISAEQTGSLVRLCVQDNGIGIAPEHLGKIFEAFQRLYGKGTYPGTGLGLAIVRKGVERMGGRVGVESEPGKGSRFWVEFRLDANPPAPARQEQESSNLVAHENL